VGEVAGADEVTAYNGGQEMAHGAAIRPPVQARRRAGRLLPGRDERSVHRQP
jgi:hypothetical protein